MKNKYIFFIFLQVFIDCFAAEKVVDSGASKVENSTKEVSPYKYRAKWICQEFHSELQAYASGLLGMGLDPKYLEILDSDRFFSLCGGGKRQAGVGKEEILTHYGVVYRKTRQALLYINYLLKNKALPDPQLFFMIMDKAPDKALIRLSVKSLFHLSSFLEKRVVEFGDFKDFFAFYQRMLSITRESNWIQLMIELAKTKKESLGDSLIRRYLAICKATTEPKNVTLVMHAVRMKLEADKIEKQRRASEEELSKLMGMLLED